MWSHGLIIHRHLTDRMLISGHPYEIQCGDRLHLHRVTVSSLPALIGIRSSSPTFGIIPPLFLPSLSSPPTIYERVNSASFLRVDSTVPEREQALGQLAPQPEQLPSIGVHAILERVAAKRRAGRLWSLISVLALPALLALIHPHRSLSGLRRLP